MRLFSCVWYLELAEHIVAVPCLGDSFSIIEVLLEAHAILCFRDGVGVETSVPSLVQSLDLGGFECDIVGSERH